MNKFMIVGRTTRDAEIMYSNDGKAVAKFDVAVNRKFAKETDEVKADFFNCVAFGKTAEVFEKCSVAKGTKLIIEGEVRNNNYTDKDGVKHYATQVVVQSFEFAESKSSSENGTSRPAPSNAANDGFYNVPDGVEDEGLPFN